MAQHVRKAVLRIPLIAVGVIVLALTGCDPIPHPDLTVREGPASTTTFELLSGDGNFVVVRSTAASTSVPSAGRWRIDRRDGSVVALPTSTGAVRISRDGSRILLSTSTTTSVLWSAGTSLTPPTGAQFSDDLTAAAFVDTDGAVKTWTTATQAVGLVETGFPRPSGTTGAVAHGISDDGRTVHFKLLHPAQPIERFIDLDANASVDRPNRDGLGSGYQAERFVLAASGKGFVHTHETGRFDPFLEALVLKVSWSELVALPSGAVRRRFTNTAGESITKELIAGDGLRAWAYQARSTSGGEPCPPAPFATSCIVSSHAVAFWGPNGLHTFDLGAGQVGGIDIAAEGRLLVVDKEITPAWGVSPTGPVRVLDAYGGVETLAQGQTLTTSDSTTCIAHGKREPCTVTAFSSRAQVSDDLSVIASATETRAGWYEYTAPPPGSGG